MKRGMTMLEQRMYKALMAIKVRIAFIGWPNETKCQVGLDDKHHPVFIPDWRKECHLIEDIQGQVELDPNMCTCGHHASVHEQADYIPCGVCECASFTSLREGEQPQRFEVLIYGAVDIDQAFMAYATKDVLGNKLVQYDSIEVNKL